MAAVSTRLTSPCTQATIARLQSTVELMLCHQRSSQVGCPGTISYNTQALSEAREAKWWAKIEKAKQRAAAAAERKALQIDAATAKRVQQLEREVLERAEKLLQQAAMTDEQRVQARRDSEVSFWLTDALMYSGEHQQLYKRCKL
jgi:hypothetical protein